MTDIPASPTTTGAPDEVPQPETLLSQFKAVDPARKGVGLDKIRMFYPRVGWDKIHAWVHQLEDAGSLKSQNVMSPKGTVAYKLYTWKEV